MSAVQDFNSLVSCLRQYTSNIVAAAYVEYVFGTDGSLVSKMSNSDGWQLNRDEFMAEHIPESMMFRLFFPRSDPAFMDHLVKVNEGNRQLHLMLAAQHLAQQEWERYIGRVRETYVVDYQVVQDLLQIASTNPSYYLRQTLESCVSKGRETNVNQVAVPSSPVAVPKEVVDVFVDVPPAAIVIDKVKGDGDCFFQSIQNQFGSQVQDKRKLSPNTLRQQVQDFARRNLSELENTVRIWRDAFRSDPTSPEWAFFRTYSSLRSDRAVAEKMVADELFLQRSFYAEEFSIKVVLAYVSNLIGYRVKLLIINRDGSALEFPSDTLQPDSLYTFLYHLPNHYDSMSVRGQRVFVRNTLPRLNLRIS
jgi:hypothetical protein